MSCSPVTRFQVSREPRSLDTVLHKCFSASLPLRWERMAEGGWCWVLPFLWLTGSGNTPAGYVPMK